MIRRLMVPITAVMVTMGAAGAYAQGFPAPLPGQSAPDSAFPPVNGSAPLASVGGAPQASFPTNGAAPIGGAGAFSAAPPTQGGGAEDCMKAFLPLREEAEKRGKLIQAAGARHAPPDEACKLIRNFGQAELKMIKYVETNSAKCGIPPQIAERLRTGHRNTDKIQKQVCTMAQRRPSAGSDRDEVLGPGDFWPASAPRLRDINPL